MNAGSPYGRAAGLGRLALILMVAAALALPGCATMNGSRQGEGPGASNQYVARAGAQNLPLLPGTGPADLRIEPPGNKPIVFVAISGGGSRAAYYAACVMEQLAALPTPDGEGSVLDSVRVISGVSAGSLAGAWYTVNYDKRRNPGFFEEFKSAMSANLQWRSFGHMAIFPPLALQLVATSVTRTDLMAAEIEKVLGGPVTFADLREAESRPYDPSPVLIASGTVYNTGQRLLMSNLPGHRLPAPVAPSKVRIRSAETSGTNLNEFIRPLTFEDFGSDIGSFKVAQAVAASAAYPLILAPYRLKVYPDYVPAPSRARVHPRLLESQTIHVADGGLIENEGIDGLLSLLKTVDKNHPVLFVVIESTFRTETERVGPNEVWGPLDVLYKMYDIGTMRPLAMYGAHIEKIHNPDRIEGIMIRLDGYDEASRAQVRSIPTSFKISGRDRAIIDQTAVENVRRMAPEIDSALRRITSR